MRPSTRRNKSSIWSMGACTVKRAMKRSCLSRQELWELMDNGTLAWFAHGGRGTRLIAWKSIVRYLDGLHAQHQTSAGACTARAERDT